MDDLEKVERLREKADVSYEEAKKALEECDGDLLDAMVFLEKQGKVKKPNASSYTTRYEESQDFTEAVKEEKEMGGAGKTFNRFFAWCGRVIEKGNQTMFRVEREEKNIIRVPVTIFVILLLLFWEIIIPVMIVGLFLSCRYSFEGAHEVRVDINKAMDKAADTADRIKNDFTEK